MQLKKLEMCGFKSFANRTEIVFDQGITGIVGPNGCGKSNVVDAIKWVLGTLSYKSVRGEEMLDVIFKGAEGVAAMGFAEVSLTLDNSDHTLPIEFEEVSITRRLFSTGEGEYYINKAPCRLKDIRELLYGTGIGTDNYSVIEQGKIDKLVLSNPHERRLVFDEAAGISKYRAKKRETENRLEKVAQDLLRIDDVVREVQKQLRSVRAQAGRAARYKELSEELKGKKLKLFTREHLGQRRRAEEIAARLAEAGSRRDALEAELGRRDAELEEAQRRMEAEAGRHGELSSALASLESRAAYLERSIEASRARCGELEAEIRRMAEDRTGLEARAAEVDGLLRSESASLRELEESVRTRAAEADEARRNLEDAVRECSRVGAELEAKKAESMEFAHKETQYRNEQARLEKEGLELRGKAEALRAQGEKLEAELADLRAKAGQAREARAGVEREIASLIVRKKAEDAEQARLRGEREQLERELSQLREGKQHRVARRETLRDLEQHLEGLEAGARTLLRERPEGVLGTVADLIDVSPEHVAAIEGALGERAGAVVFETAAQAAAAVALVRERGLGRTTVIALDECRNGWFSDVELLAAGVVGRASAWVRSEERARAMVDALLGHTLVMADRDAARAIRRDGLTEWPLVTPDGEVLDHPGITVTGGARAAQGLISRKAELRTLEDEIDRYLTLIAERDARRADADERLKACDERLERLRQQVYERNIDLGETAAQAEQLSVREQFLSSERQAIEGERAAVERQGAAVAERTAALETLLAELGWLRSQVGEEIASLGKLAERYQAGRAELQEAVTKAQVESAKAGEQQLAVGKRLEMHARTRDEVAQSLGRLEGVAAEARARLEAATAEAARHEEDRRGLQEEVGRARTRAEESARAREALAAGCDAVRTAKSAAEAELGPCEAEINALRIEEEGLRVKAETLLRRAKEELEIDLDAPPPPPAPAPEAPVEPSAEAPTDPAPAGEAPAPPAEEPVDVEALSREVEELRVKLAGFGAVNVVALDQLNELEEREKYLIAQQEDLQKSKGQLEELIRDLNKESRELFEKTFDFVKEQFNVIFRKIFGGGKGDLVLEQAENVDPMEQGLEILARPPGKELTSISLLSGGERSLTAIALVMALFKANPSPFCLLDEADAALDEKNVERYAGVVREFASEKTQFIVITHNKRTMAVCDALYGVTMEQQGVSKKVSVNLAGDRNLEVLKSKAAAPGI
jgi:chromosome segregation protein